MPYAAEEMIAQIELYDCECEDCGGVVRVSKSWELLKAWVAKSQEALEFYADEGNWLLEYVPYTGGHNSDGSYQEPEEETCACWQDIGDHARAALGKSQ